MSHRLARHAVRALLALLLLWTPASSAPLPYVAAAAFVVERVAAPAVARAVVPRSVAEPRARSQLPGEQARSEHAAPPREHFAARSPSRARYLLYCALLC